MLGGCVEVSVGSQWISVPFDVTLGSVLFLKSGASKSSQGYANFCGVIDRQERPFFSGKQWQFFFFFGRNARTLMHELSSAF